jgi:hypothetical protein
MRMHLMILADMSMLDCLIKFDLPNSPFSNGPSGQPSTLPLSQPSGHPHAKRLPSFYPSSYPAFQYTLQKGYSIYTLLDSNISVYSYNNSCQRGLLELRSNWILAPNNSMTKIIISSSPWSTKCLVDASGSAYSTSFVAVASCYAICGNSCLLTGTNSVGANVYGVATCPLQILTMQ